MPLTFFDALREVIRVFPYFTESAVVWVVALVAGIRLCVIARRRAALRSAANPPTSGPVPNRRLEWLAAAGPIAYLATAVIATLNARARLLGAFRGGETATRVTAVSDALGGLLNPLMFAIEASLPLVLLATYTIALHAWAHHAAEEQVPRAGDISWPRSRWSSWGWPRSVPESPVTARSSSS